VTRGETFPISLAGGSSSLAAPYLQLGAAEMYLILEDLRKRRVRIPRRRGKAS
jgi:hypothetical protein